MVPDRGNRHGVPGTLPVGMLHSQHAQRPTWPRLQENGVLELPQLMQGVAEPGCAIGVPGPIGRLDSLASCYPRPGDVAYVRNCRLVQLNLPQPRLKCRHDRIKHSRMKGMSILNAPTNDALFVQHPL